MPHIRYIKPLFYPDHGGNYDPLNSEDALAVHSFTLLQQRRDNAAAQQDYDRKHDDD
jgi:hypothetical protein